MDFRDTQARYLGDSALPGSQEHSAYGAVTEWAADRFSGFWKD